MTIDPANLFPPGADADQFSRGVLLRIARETVESVATERRKTTLYSEPALTRAAALLADMWDAGERHGVPRAKWSWVSDLGSSVLDVIDFGEPPQTGEEAKRLIDAEYAALVDRLDATAVVRRDLFSISLDPPTTGIAPTRSTYFPAHSRVTLMLDREVGWGVCIPAATGSRHIRIAAPFDDATAAAVADIVVKVNAGGYGDTLFNR